MPAVPGLGHECLVNVVPGRGVSPAASPKAGEIEGSSFCTGNLFKKEKRKKMMAQPTPTESELEF